MYKFAITPYIKSKSEVEKIREKYNVENFISLQEFSQASIKQILQALSSLSGRTLIYVSNKEEQVFMNIMSLLFLFSPSFKADLVDINGNKSPYNKLTVLWLLLKPVWLTLKGFFLLLISYLACFFCSSSKSLKKTINSKYCLYLKSNFWVSVKAGGSVGHVEGVIKGLTQHGYTVTYGGLDNYRADMTTLPIHSLKDSSLLGEINACLFDYSYYKQLCQFPCTDYHFIYHRMSLNSRAALKYARKNGIPFILEYNGSDVWIQRNWGKPLLFEKFSSKIELTNLRNADLVVTISEPLRKELLQKGIPDEKIVMYPNCVDSEKYDPSRFPDSELMKLRASLEISPETLVFTFIGTFGKWHGVELLVEALRDIYLKDKNFFSQQQSKFVLVGDGLMMPTVKQIIEQTPGLEKYILLTGIIKQQDAIPYLAMSDVFLSPHVPQPDGKSFFGSPTKLFEYLAMSKPIIASNLDQQGEILSQLIRKEKNKGVLLFEPGNKEELIEKIREVTSNYEELLPYCKGIRDYVIAHYTWNIHVNKILEKL